MSLPDGAQRLRPEHRAAVERALAARRRDDQPGQACLSDLSFGNLYLFREVHRWTLHGGQWPVISGHAYDGQRMLIPLFALDRAPLDALRGLLADLDALAFAPLGLEEVRALDPGHWTWEAARDEADYLYRAEDLRHYRGRLLQKKRNLARQLLAVHQVGAEPLGDDNRAACVAVLEAWMQEKSQRAGGADELPCREALAQSDALGLEGVVHRVDGTVGGFLLAEALAARVRVIRFAKALPRFKGLYQHMFQRYCQDRPEVDWINFEQDMGVPGLRQTKLSYAPHRLIEKFRARPL
jgi:hypothetical protein